MDSATTPSERLRHPLRKVGRHWYEISYEEAFALITERFSQTNPKACAFFAGGHATNEELYLLQRLARAGFKTNNVASFESLLRGEHFCFDKNDIVPFAELSGATQLFCIGFDWDTKHDQLSYIQNFIKKHPDIPTLFLDRNEHWPVADCYAFFKAVNQRLIATNRAKGIFIQGVGKDYAPYREVMLQTDITPLLKRNSMSIHQIDSFITLLLARKAPLFIYREALLSEAAIAEMTNLAMLIEIQARQSSGLLGIKERFNSQALFDMGLFASLSPGGVAFSPQTVAEMTKLYGTPVACQVCNVRQLWENRQLQCVFILYEDPLSEKEYFPFRQCFNFDFLCVMAHTLTPAAQLADLVLPGSLPAEIGGIYTDSTRQPHQIAQSVQSPVAMSSIAQLSALSEQFGLAPLRTPDTVFLEYINFFKGGCRSANRHFFRITGDL
jgi:formate dehydrogenase major subunit